MDAILNYPKFHLKPFSPNQVVVICQYVLNYIIFIGLIYSKLSKNIRIVYFLMHLLTFRFMLGYLNLIRDDYSSSIAWRNHINASIPICGMIFQINFLTQLHSKLKHKILISFFYIMLLLIKLVVFDVNISELAWKDVFFLIGLIIGLLVASAYQASF